MKWFLRISTVVFVIVGIIAWKNCGHCELNHTGSWQGGWLPHNSNAENTACQWSLDFDGIDDYVNCGNNLSLCILHDITICGWIYRPAGAGTALRAMVGKFDSGYLLGIYQNVGYWGIRYWPGGVWNWTFDLAAPPMSDSEWVFLVGTYIDSFQKVYINANLQAVDTFTFDSLYHRTIFGVAIGRRSASASGNYWKGMISEVQIYNRGMDSDEIAWLYANPCQVYNTDSLQAWWKIEEGVGDTTFDETANNNDGILGGGVEARKPAWAEDSP